MAFLYVSVGLDKGLNVGSVDDEHTKSVCSPQPINVLNLYLCDLLRQELSQLRHETLLTYFLIIKDSISSDSEKSI